MKRPSTHPGPCSEVSSPTSGKPTAAPVLPAKPASGAETPQSYLPRATERHAVKPTSLPAASLCLSACFAPKSSNKLPPARLGPPRRSIDRDGAVLVRRRVLCQTSASRPSRCFLCTLKNPACLRQPQAHELRRNASSVLVLARRAVPGPGGGTRLG